MGRWTGDEQHLHHDERPAARGSPGKPGPGALRHRARTGAVDRGLPPCGAGRWPRSSIAGRAPAPSSSAAALLAAGTSAEAALDAHLELREALRRFAEAPGRSVTLLEAAAIGQTTELLHGPGHRVQRVAAAGLRHRRPASARCSSRRRPPPTPSSSWTAAHGWRARTSSRTHAGHDASPPRAPSTAGSATCSGSRPLLAISWLPDPPRLLLGRLARLGRGRRPPRPSERWRPRPGTARVLWVLASWSSSSSSSPAWPCCLARRCLRPHRPADGCQPPRRGPRGHRAGQRPARPAQHGRRSRAARPGPERRHHRRRPDARRSPT